MLHHNKPTFRLSELIINYFDFNFHFFINKYFTNGICLNNGVIIAAVVENSNKNDTNSIINPKNI